MIVGRDFLGLCALGLALVPAALLAQSYGPSVLAQPTSSSVIASSEQEEVLAPDGEIIAPDDQPQLVAPDSFWLDPVAVEGDGVSVKDDSFFGPGFVEYCDCLQHVAGFEVLLMHPISEPSQSVVLTDLVAQEQFRGTAEAGFGSGIRLWWGMEYGWLGYRIRYTHFGVDQIDADPAVPTPPLDGTSEAFHNSYLLDANVVDFEMTQRFCWHQHYFQASFGGRYVSLERNATAVGYGVLGEGVELAGVATGANDMQGGGLTFSLAGTSPIWHHGCWSWFWNLRGSALWVDQSAYARTHASAEVKPPVGAGSSDSVDQAFALVDDQEAVFLGEVQLGIQYEKPCCCIRGDFLFRIAFEYQHWGTGDVLAGSESFAALAGGVPPFGGLVESTAFAHDGDLDLIGLTIGAGLTY